MVFPNASYQGFLPPHANELRPRGPPPASELVCKRLAGRIQESDGKYVRRSVHVVNISIEQVCPLTDHISRLLASGYMSDCKVICWEVEWNTHREILCSRNKWFRAALGGNFEVDARSLHTCFIGQMLTRSSLHRKP